MSAPDVLVPPAPGSPGARAVGASGRRRGRPPAVLLVPGAVAAAVALLPLVYLVLRAFERGPEVALEIIWQERTLRLVLRSLGLAAVVTLAALVVGTSLAWLTSRARLPGARLLTVLAALPLAVPTYVAAYIWVSFFPRIPPFAGSVLVLTLCTYPYVFLPVRAALQGTDPALEEVSRSLGRGRWRTLAGVTLRQVRPAMAAGGLLVALYVLSDFGAVSLLRFDSLTRVIYTSYRSSFDRTPAAVLGLVLVLVTVCIVWAESRSRGRAAQARVGGGAARRHVPALLGPAGTAAALTWCTAIAALAVLFPFAGLVRWLLAGRSAGIDAGRVAEAAGSTIGVSFLGALLTVALAVPVGVLAVRYRGRLVSVIEQASYAGHALPGIVVALALVFLAVRYAFPVYQRTPVLILAYAVLFLPAAVGAVRASVALSPPGLEEVARSLGRSPLQALRDVTLRVAGPGVAAGAVLVFLTCMKELPATLLLRPTGMQTLATELWSRTTTGAYAAAAPYAALLVLLAAIPTFLLTTRSATLGTGGDR